MLLHSIHAVLVHIVSVHNTVPHSNNSTIFTVLTKHGLEASHAVNVVIKVDLALSVTIADHQAIERGIAHTQTYQKENIHEYNFTMYFEQMNEWCFKPQFCTVRI